MSEYIRKQAVLNLIDDFEFGNAIAADYGNVHEFQKLYDAVRSIPPADVAPVVHARWNTSERCDEHYIECSSCKGWIGGIVFVPKPRYCPFCGARMGGEEE